MIKTRDSIFIVIIGALLVCLLHTCDSAKRVADELAAEQEVTKIWRDKYGRSNAEYRVSTILKDNVIDSLRKVHIKPRTVKTIVTVTTETKDTVYVSAGRPHISKWSTFTFLDSNRIAYSIRDSLALITHKKGYGFLNLKTKYVTRAISFNPHTTLTGITSVEILPRQRRLSFGLYAGYGIQISGGIARVGPTFGVGLNYRIF